jgi:hypothetical protein
MREIARAFPFKVPQALDLYILILLLYNLFIKLRGLLC